MIFVVLASCLLLFFFLPADTPEKHGPAGKDHITILWADWAPANYFQLLTEDFTKETGIKVDILQESWTGWQSRFFDEMAKKRRKYDMVIGDSQWLGRGAMGGHYVSLTKWIP